MTVGLYRTSRPVRKSGKFLKSGLSGNRTFFFLDTGFLTLLEMEKQNKTSFNFTTQVTLICMHFHTSGKIAWLRDVIIKILHLHIHDIKWDLCMTCFYLDSDFDTPSFTYLQQVWKKSLRISKNTCAGMISFLRTLFLLFLLRWEGWLVIQTS